MREYKPLSKKELKRGKDRVKIFNTDSPMPWDKVFSRIRLGFPYGDLDKKYGHLRKIILFAILEEVSYDPEPSKLVDDIVDVRIRKKELAIKNPAMVATIEEAINEYAPDIYKKVAVLATAVIDKAIKEVPKEETGSNDVNNYITAAQKATDMVSITQRHASTIGVNMHKPLVEAFDFVEDFQDAEIEEVENKNG